MAHYYFAYGSNMSLNQMNNRCPSNKYLGQAKLTGYKFVYDGWSSKRNGAVANIIKAENSFVLGGLYELNGIDIHYLDIQEGYPSIYNRKKLVVNFNNKNIEADVYLRKPLVSGEPSKDYVNTILQGAKDCKLPPDYIEENLLL